MVDGQPSGPLPAELAQLLADGGAGQTLPVALPAGHLMLPSLHGGETAGSPAYWLSDAPAPTALWSRLHAAHRQSGLWPLLLEGLDRDPARPWAAGEVGPQPASEIDGQDAAAFLASVWADWAEEQEGEEDLDYDFEDLAPFGRDWPGLAPAGEQMEDPNVVADWYAGLLLGVGVVRVGFDTLGLSVAAPPVSAEHALLVAAEHFAFCPDNIQQGSADTLAGYAEQISAKNSWSFWWD